MISSDQDQEGVELSFAAIYKAVSSAELQLRMKRDALLREHMGAIRQAKWDMREARYTARNSMVTRIYNFVNGSRESLIRKIRLSEAESLHAENQALERSCDMSQYNEDQDIAHKLRLSMNQNMKRKTLSLSKKYLQFVKTYNEAAFKKPAKKDPPADDVATAEQGDAD